MNKRDIFISYKRIDKNIVFNLKNRIEEEVKKNSCWIDLDGIESDAQFAEVIMRAIDNAELVLFMYSAAHSKIRNYSTDWTVRELNYAQQKTKRIVFVNIDNTPFSDWFSMMFPYKQIIDGTSSDEVDKLISDIKKWLKEASVEKKTGQKTYVSDDYSPEIPDEDYETAEVLFNDKEYAEAIPLYLSSATNGNTNAQSKLCQIFYDEVVSLDIVPNDFWNSIEDIASNNEDYANFIIHCKYYKDASNNNLSFQYVRKATKNSRVPLAFLRLAISYAWGLGTKQNETLANHNYHKAMGLGCKEACSYLGQIYELGSIKIKKDVSKAIEYYERGAELLDKRSMHRLANCYHYELRQKDKAKEIAKKMINAGYEYGYVLMGNFYSFDSDYSWADTYEGKKWYREALLHDAYEAYASLAYVYWFVDGDYKEAYALAKQGYARRNSESMRALGLFYQMDTEYDKAWACYKELFDKTGSTGGKLGELFFTLNYRKENKEQENRLEEELESMLKVEAYLGDEDSLKYLLRLYLLQETGEDTLEYSKLKAVPKTYEYIKQGADSGQTDMMLYFGKILLEEDYKEYNPVKGLDLILRSALGGDNASLTYLFDYYQSGRYKDSVDYDSIAVAAIKRNFIERKYLGSLIKYGETHAEIDEDFLKFLSAILDKDEKNIEKKCYIQALNAFFVKNDEKGIEIEAETIVKYKLFVEQERIAGNYGSLSKMRTLLHKFYPEYNKEKAIADFIKDRATVDSDILYATSTTDNESEIDIDRQDSLLSQLYSPIIQDNELWEKIKNQDVSNIVGGDERELTQALCNLTSSYVEICKENGIVPFEISAINDLDLIPYCSPRLLTILRKQTLKCLLSIKDIDPLIATEFLNKLDNDDQLLNVCEKISNQDVQLFLISFIEINLDIEALEKNYYGLLENYKDNKQILVGCLNTFVKKLEEVGIEHSLPEYNTDNLPNINLSPSFFKSNIDHTTHDVKSSMESIEDDDFDKLLREFINSSDDTAPKQ